MKKKLLSFIFALCLIIPCALFVGCTKDKEPTSPPTPEPVNEVNVLFSEDGKTLYRFAPDNDETEYTVPEGVEIVDASAFKNCDNLTKIILPTTLNYVLGEAFRDCNNLITVEINSDIAIGEKAFSECRKLASINTSKIVSYGVPGMMVKIPATDAFYNCKALTNVAIAKEVKELPEGIFSGTDFLTSISFEANSTLERIGEEAFYSSNLTSINLPQSCTTIEERAFAYSGLINIVIGKNITTINDYAFYNCDNLLTVDFETGRTKSLNGSMYFENIDGSSMFESCDKLKTVVNYPSAFIAPFSFKDCKELEQFTFATILTSGAIGGSAFYNCHALKEISLPVNMNQIQGSAFYRCYSLNKIVIPALAGPESNSFEECYGLFEIYNLNSNLQLTLGDGIAKFAKDIYTSLDSSSKIKSVNNMVYYDNGTDFIALAPVDRNAISIELDSKTTEINKYAFWNCENLTNIVLQEGVTKIGEAAFEFSGLRNIELPESLIEIEYDAFNYCVNLYSITINNETLSNNLIGDVWNRPLGEGALEAEVLYIKIGLDVSNSTYLSNYSKQSTSDKEGYDMYVNTI